MKHTQVKELAARLLTFHPTKGLQGLDEFSRELTQLINSGQKVNFEIDDARKIANDAWEFSEGMSEVGWKLALTKSIDEFWKRKWNEACGHYEAEQSHANRTGIPVINIPKPTYK